jgi:hypothetical protein
MAIYSIGVRTTDITIAHPGHTIVSAATDRLALLEYGLFLAGAGATTQGIGRPAAAGVGATATINLQAEDPANPASTALSVLEWTTTDPTAPTIYFRRIGLPATIGVGVIWTFPRGLIIAISSNLVLWNIVAVTTGIDAYAVIDE